MKDCASMGLLQITFSRFIMNVKHYKMFVFVFLPNRYVEFWNVALQHFWALVAPVYHSCLFISSTALHRVDIFFLKLMGN